MIGSQRCDLFANRTIFCGFKLNSALRAPLILKSCVGSEQRKTHLHFFEFKTLQLFNHDVTCTKNDLMRTLTPNVANSQNYKFIVMIVLKPENPIFVRSTHAADNSIDMLRVVT